MTHICIVEQTTCSCQCNECKHARLGSVQTGRRYVDDVNNLGHITTSTDVLFLVGLTSHRPEQFILFGWATYGETIMYTKFYIIKHSWHVQVRCFQVQNSRVFKQSIILQVDPICLPPRLLLQKQLFRIISPSKNKFHIFLIRLITKQQFTGARGQGQRSTKHIFAKASEA